MDDVTDLEAEKRRRLVASIRRDNDARRTELEAEIEANFFTRRIEHPNDRDRREIGEQEKRWKHEREAKQHTRETSIEALTLRLAALEQRIGDERRAVVEALGEEVGQLLSDANADLSEEVALLRREVVALTETIVELTSVALNEQATGAEKVVRLHRVN